MPRIPNYTAQVSLDTDRGGMPSLRGNDPVGGAIRNLGRSISQLNLPFSGNSEHRGGEDPSRGQPEREARLMEFQKIQAVAAITAGWEAELEKRKKAIAHDGGGFHEAFAREAITPAIVGVLSEVPDGEQDALRRKLEAEAEPFLEAAGVIERVQSVRYFDQETDRVADSIYADLDLEPESFEYASEKLHELLAAAPIAEISKPGKALQLRQGLSRRLYRLALANNPEWLISGALGTTQRGERDTTKATGGASVPDAESLPGGSSDRIAFGEPDPRFSPLPLAERQELHDEAVATIAERDKRARVADLVAKQAAAERLMQDIDHHSALSSTRIEAEALNPGDKRTLKQRFRQALTDRKRGESLLEAIDKGKAAVDAQDKDEIRIANQLFGKMTEELDDRQRGLAGRAFARATGYIPQRAGADLLAQFSEPEHAAEALNAAEFYREVSAVQFEQLTDGTDIPLAIKLYRSHLDSGFSAEESAATALRQLR